MEIRLEPPNEKRVNGTLPLRIHVPGLIRWAKKRFAESRGDRRVMPDLVAERFGLPRALAVALLSGEVDYQVDGEDVVFNWPDPPQGGATYQGS